MAGKGKNKAKDNAGSGAPQGQTPAGAAVSEAMQAFGSLVMATKQGGFLFWTLAQIGTFDPSYTLPNHDMKQGDAVGVKASDAGIAWYEAQTGVQQTTATASTATDDTASEYEILSGVTLPTVKRGFGDGAGRPRGSQYPFDKLEVNGCFVVLATEKMPNPAKSLASTVSSASRKWSKEIPGKFHDRAVPLRNDDGSLKKDASGKTLTETKQFPDREYERVFEIRHVADFKALVDAGQTQFAKYAGKSGALIGRTK